MNMKSLVVIFCLLFSFQLAEARDVFNDSDTIEYVRTKVKNQYATYVVQNSGKTITVWRSDYDIEKDEPNVLFLDQLPKLTVLNKDKLDSYIEEHLPKQPNADEWIDAGENLLIMISADRITGKIVNTAFGFDSKLILPIEKVAEIDKFIRENCSLMFEQTSVTRKANYIPYDYRYFFKKHKLRK